MKRIWIVLAALAITGAAHAQLYKWVDKDGKVRYSDAPPPGAKASTLKGAQSGPAEAPVPAASKDAKKAPLTPAEQAQEFRKRQAEARKASEKADAEGQAKTELSEACARSREYLSTLNSGQRIARTNPSGERYYLDENQVAQEIAKAQQAVQKSCK